MLKNEGNLIAFLILISFMLKVQVHQELKPIKIYKLT